jgi:hypothetical protein
MTTRLPVLAILIAFAAVATSPRLAAQGVSLDQVLDRAADYVSAYAERFASVVSDERSVQRSQSSVFSGGNSREIRSDFLVVRVPSTATWIGFRDVYEVNGVAVRDRQDRLMKLFTETPASAVSHAQQIADESARFNLGDIKRNFNLPTTALFFLLPSSQFRLRFKHDGEQVRDGERYWIVKGAEFLTPTFISTASGRDVKVSTTYWIDPESGRVARSELRIAEPVRTTIAVDYRPDEKLAMWVPREMDESYEQGATRITCIATYSNFRRFQVSTDTTFRH